MSTVTGVPMSQDEFLKERQTDEALRLSLWRTAGLMGFAAASGLFGLAITEFGDLDSMDLAHAAQLAVIAILVAFFALMQLSTASGAPRIRTGLLIVTAFVPTIGVLTVLRSTSIAAELSYAFLIIGVIQLSMTLHVRGAALGCFALVVMYGGAALIFGGSMQEGVGIFVLRSFVAALVSGTVYLLTVRLEISRDSETEHTRQLTFHSLVLGAIGKAVIAIDTDDAVTYWNPAAEVTYGWTAQEASGKNLFELLSPRAIESGGGPAAPFSPLFSGEQHHTSKSGGAIPVNCVVVAVEEGPAAGTRVLVCRDLRDQRRAEEATRFAAKAARESRATASFLSSMSHELRTPMNSIMGFTQLMTLDDTLPEKHRLGAQNILQSGHHLLSLIDEILDIARVRGDALALAIEPVSVPQALDEVRGMIEGAGADVDVAVLMPPKRPGEPPWVVADKVRLRQILLNLMSNAVKFNHPGGNVECTIEELETGYARISGSSTTGAGSQKPIRSGSSCHLSGSARSRSPGPALAWPFPSVLPRLWGGPSVSPANLALAVRSSSNCPSLPKVARRPPSPRRPVKVRARPP